MTDDAGEAVVGFVLILPLMLVTVIAEMKLLEGLTVALTWMDANPVLFALAFVIGVGILGVLAEGESEDDSESDENEPWDAPLFK